METTQDASNGGTAHGQGNAINPPGGPDVWDSISLHNTTGSHRSAILKRSQTLHPLKCGQSNESLGSRSNASSTTNRACRICQSETGILIRPCRCAGTVANIHAECLNEWVIHSKKETCEICKEEYAKGGQVYKPFREWTRPSVTASDLFQVASMVGLVYVLVYIFTLFGERKFTARVFRRNMSMRSFDGCLILIFILIVLLFGASVTDIVDRIGNYLRRQQVVNFVNNEPPKCSDATHD